MPWSASGTGGYGDATHWANVTMPAMSYWAHMRFPAPTDAALWEVAKKEAMSGKQVLLEQVLRTIHSPGDILSGDTHFRRLKKLVDVETSDREGFKPLKGKTHGCCTERAPVTLLGGGENVKGMFSIKSVVKYLKKHGDTATAELPAHGIVALGSTDENWGWLSTHFLNRTASWEFEFAEPPSPLRLPMDGQVQWVLCPATGRPWPSPHLTWFCFEFLQLNDIRTFLDHPKLIILVINQHNNVSHLHPKVRALAVHAFSTSLSLSGAQMPTSNGHAHR